MCTTGLPPVPTFPHARTCMMVCIAYLHYVYPADVIEKRAAAGSPWPPAPAEAAGWFSSDGSIVMVGWDRLYLQHEGSHSNYTKAMQERQEQQRKRNGHSSNRDIILLFFTVMLWSFCSLAPGAFSGSPVGSSVSIRLEGKAPSSS